MKKKVETIYTFKSNFTKEELEDLISWFEARMEKLPATMQIDNSNYTENLPLTIKAYISMLKNRVPNTTFCGYISHLELIRKRLQLEGME